MDATRNLREMYVRHEITPHGIHLDSSEEFIFPLTQETVESTVPIDSQEASGTDYCITRRRHHDIASADRALFTNQARRVIQSNAPPTGLFAPLAETASSQLECTDSWQFLSKRIPCGSLSFSLRILINWQHDQCMGIQLQEDAGNFDVGEFLTATLADIPTSRLYFDGDASVRPDELLRWGSSEGVEIILHPPCFGSIRVARILGALASPLLPSLNISQNDFEAVVEIFWSANHPVRLAENQSR